LWGKRATATCDGIHSTKCRIAAGSCETFLRTVFPNLNGYGCITPPSTQSTLPSSTCSPSSSSPSRLPTPTSSLPEIQEHAQHSNDERPRSTPHHTQTRLLSIPCSSCLLDAKNSALSRAEDATAAMCVWATGWRVRSSSPAGTQHCPLEPGSHSAPRMPWWAYPTAGQQRMEGALDENEAAWK
jgi:hypothetical protein